IRAAHADGEDRALGPEVVDLDARAPARFEQALPAFGREREVAAVGHEHRELRAGAFVHETQEGRAALDISPLDERVSDVAELELRDGRHLVERPLLPADAWERVM